MILFPLFAEQDYNANFFEARGIGKVLEITTLKSHELQGAIQEITQDKKYVTDDLSHNISTCS